MPSSRRPRALLAFAVVLTLVVAAVVVVWVRPEVWPFRQEAVLLGDSITVVSEDALREELRRGYQVDIEARSGYRTDQLLTEVPEGATTASPDQVVINLGTNDVGQSWPLDQSRRPCAASSSGSPTPDASTWSP
ncbi:MAG: SGNH/GDSL hydrolase family protein [Acidimicrobiales bacterium]